MSQLCLAGLLELIRLLCYVLLFIERINHAMISRKTGTALFILCLILLVCGLRGDVEFPLVQSLAFFPFSDNRDLNRREMDLGLKIDYSNVYSLDFNQYGVNDFEMTGLVLSCRYGLLDGLTLELYYRYVGIFGGFLDGGIEAFHDFFNLPAARRDYYEANSVNYFYRSFFDYNHSTGIGSPLVLSVLKSLAGNPHLKVSGRLFLGIPLYSKPGLVSDRIFGGAGVVGLFTKGHFRAESSLHMSFLGQPEWLAAEELRSFVILFNLELGFRGLRAGLNVKTSPYTSDYFSSNAHQLYVGYRFSRWIEIGIVEDLPPMDTTPDVGFYIKLVFPVPLKK
jgi:hypothetical protein